MKKLFALGAAALLAVGLVSCDKKQEQGGEQGGEITTPGKTINLTYSGTASDKDFNETLFTKFKEARKNAGDTNTYVITYVEHGPDKVDSEIQDWAAQGTAPDVFEFASDKITGLYQKGALAKLSVKQAGEVKKNNSELGYKLATFNGSTYAYPYTGDNTYYLQYDKSKMSAEEAKSVEGIFAACAREGLKFGYNIKEAFWGGAAMFTFGADYSMSFDEDGSVSKIEANFDGDAGLKAAKAIQTIMTSPYWTNDMGAPTPQNSFIGCIAGTWDISSYKESLGDDYACAVMPTITIDGETKHLGAFLGGKLLGVNPNVSGSDTDRLSAAHLLAQFLSNEECQLERFEHAGIAPCNNNAAKNSKVTSDANVKVLIEHATYAHEQTAVPNDFWTAPATLTSGIADKSISTAEELAAAVKAFNDSVKASK